MKKEWTKPKLIRLYSGRPDEAVLTSCRDSAGGDASAGDFLCGPGTGDGSCASVGS